MAENRGTTDNVCWDEQQDLEEAIRRSLAAVEGGAPPGADPEEEALSLALARTLQFEEAEPASELARRKEREEQATSRVLGAAQQYFLEARPLAPAAGAQGGVQIGGRRYARVERGSTHGEHRNLCCYLALTDGDAPAAVALKQRLAPAATQLARALGAPCDFGAPDALADTEVLQVYAATEKRPVCVYSAAAGGAVVYRTADCTGETVYLYLGPGHFQRLVPL